MEKIKIGIPKALLYYKYKDLWINFFENLNCEIIISPNTNKDILEIGKKFVLDEACLSMKIFMGHVHYLLDKCDYILIPRIACLKKNEKVCTNFMTLYDLCRNTFDKSFLHYNIDINKNEQEEYAFIGLGLQLGFTFRKARAAYRKAKSYEQMQNERKISKQKMIIASTTKTKILLAGHAYNLYDNLIGKEIINYLESQNIELIYSDCYDPKYLNIDYKKIAPKNYFTYNKEIIGSIAFYRNFVDGIILITTFPCGPDSLSNEMIIRNADKPLLTLIMDELNSDTGLITRLESFIDIIKERKEQNEQR